MIKYQVGENIKERVKNFTHKAHLRQDFGMPKNFVFLFLGFLGTFVVLAHIIVLAHSKVMTHIMVLTNIMVLT